MSFQMKKNKIMKHRILRYLFSLTFVATTFSLGDVLILLIRHQHLLPSK